MDPKRFWEILKFEIANECKEFAKASSLSEKTRLFNLYRLLNDMQQELIEGDQDSVNKVMNNMGSVRQEIKSFEDRDVTRAMFRCRANWQQFGEKSSKYFFNLEKRNYIKKTMYIVKKPDGTLTKDYREILNEQYQFYRHLYTRDSSVQFRLTNDGQLVVPEDTKEMFEQFISKDELFDAMMTLKLNKVLGVDGLSLLLYRKLWNDLCDPLHEMLSQAYEEGDLSNSARKGIISLIPKKDKDDKSMKNWRPITLLNYDYKIYAKALSNHMDTVMQRLVPPHQTGFVKGRSIHSNLVKTREIISFLNKANRPGVIALVDFEKCFDRINYESIKASLKYLNYRPCFIRMVSVLYSNFMVCTTNNGNLSDYFIKGHGVNQGCPASPGIYTQTSAIISHLITSNSNIRGISMDSLEYLLSQFADDTAAFLTFEPICINAFCNVLSEVESNFGLKVSYEKTSMYRVGSIAKSEAKVYTTKEVNWSNEPIVTLGAVFNTDGTPNESNYRNIMKKIDVVCNAWQNRTLSLLGKILIINSLIGSLFVYSMTVMIDLTEDQIQAVYAKIHSFLWNGKKRGRISLRTLCKNKSDGGAGLVNLKSKQAALKIQQIFNLEANMLTRCYSELGIATVGDLTWLCNLSEKDCLAMFGKSSFWSQMLTAWCKINYRTPCTKDELEFMPIWLNSELKIDQRVLLWRKWLADNVVFIGDLFDKDGNLISWETLKDKVTSANWLDWLSITNAIPKSWIAIMKEPKGDPYIPLHKELLQKKKISREVYQKLNQDVFAVIKYAESWRKTGLPNLDFDEYRESFEVLWKITNISKLRDFQYRLLLNKLVFNSDLCQWGKSENDQCSFCSSKVETARHILMECEQTCSVWRKFKDIFKLADISFETVVLNKFNSNPKSIVNLVALIIKQYLYRCRCKNVKPQQAWSAVDHVMLNEIYNGKLVGSLRKIYQKWSLYKPELAENYECTESYVREYLDRI